MLIVAVHYGSYLRADQYLYKIIDRPPTCMYLSSNHFVQILYLYTPPPRFLEYSVVYIV